MVSTFRSDRTPRRRGLFFPCHNVPDSLALRATLEAARPRRPRPRFEDLQGLFFHGVEVLEFLDVPSGFAAGLPFVDQGKSQPEIHRSIVLTSPSDSDHPATPLGILRTAALGAAPVVVAVKVAWPLTRAGRRCWVRGPEQRSRPWGRLWNGLSFVSLMGGGLYRGIGGRDDLTTGSTQRRPPCGLPPGPESGARRLPFWSRTPTAKCASSIRAARRVAGPRPKPSNPFPASLPISSPSVDRFTPGVHHP